MEAGKEGVMELKEGKNNIEEEEERRKAPTIRETRHEKVDSSIQPTQRHTPNQQQTTNQHHHQRMKIHATQDSLFTFPSPLSPLLSPLSIAAHRPPARTTRT